MAIAFRLTHIVMPTVVDMEVTDLNLNLTVDEDKGVP